MELYGKIRCVTYQELVGSGLMSVSNFKKHVREHRFFVVQKGGNGRMALIDYNSLPDRLRKKYNEMFPDALEQLNEKKMVDALQHDGAAVEYFRRVETAKGGLTDVKQAEYVLNAQVLNKMVQTENEVKALHAKSGHVRPAVIWEQVYSVCEKLREAYGHTLPNNEARLREKLRMYKKSGYSVLVSAKNGNQTARKISDEQARVLLALKRSKTPIYTDRQIYDEYNRIAVERGYKPIKSMTTITNYLNDPAVQPLWYSAVHGTIAWKQKYSAQMKTSLPQMRDSLWYSDGTKLNLYYRNEAGKVCTTSVYEVMDAYSEVFLGYDIAPGETFESQYKAFRMAVEVAGCKPYEIVNDNQGGHKKLGAQGFFRKIAMLHRPTMPYNGQSKTIENAFGRFQQQVLHKYWFFTGQNITATKKTSHANMEFILHNQSKLPTLAELKEIYRQCREEWNNMPHPHTGVSRMEMYRQSSNPDTVPVSVIDMVDMFWLTSRNSITYTNQGLKLTVSGRAYEYEVYEDSGLRDDVFAMRNIGRKFYVKYDPMDFSRVELWEDVDGESMRFAAIAKTRIVVARATQERTEEQTSYMRQVIEQNRRLMGSVHLAAEQFDIEEQISAELFGLNSPRPRNVSKEAMEKLEADEVAAPVMIPQAEECSYTGIGSYEKAVSNLDYSELDCLDRF